jgi:hypothetical protein
VGERGGRRGRRDRENEGCGQKREEVREGGSSMGAQDAQGALGAFRIVRGMRHKASRRGKMAWEEGGVDGLSEARGSRADVRRQAKTHPTQTHTKGPFPPVCACVRTSPHARQPPLVRPFSGLKKEEQRPCPSDDFGRF